MDRLTRHEAIVTILGVPETHLSTVYKAGIIELLFDSTPEKYKDTDNPAMYERPRDSYISNSSSCR